TAGVSAKNIHCNASVPILDRPREVNFYVFFFSSRRRHTRFSRDWSSDCALPIYLVTTARLERGLHQLQKLLELLFDVFGDDIFRDFRLQLLGSPMLIGDDFLDRAIQITTKQTEIGRASCRERV